MNSMQFGLDEEEKEELCKKFDTQKNGRSVRFHKHIKCLGNITTKNT